MAGLENKHFYILPSFFDVHYGHGVHLAVCYLLTFITKVCSVKKETKLNQVFCLIKSSEIIFIFLPGFYLIIWLMTSPKNFEKIPILKTRQLIFF